MRIETFLRQSPVFAINLAARRFDAHAGKVLAADGLSLSEGLILAALFFLICLALNLLALRGHNETSILDTPATTGSAPAKPGTMAPAPIGPSVPKPR